MFGHDPSGHVAPQLRDLGERLRRTYCSAARGAVEVVSAPREAGTPVQELPDIVFGVCVCVYAHLCGGERAERGAMKGNIGLQTIGPFLFVYVFELWGLTTLTQADPRNAPVW